MYLTFTGGCNTVFGDLNQYKTVNCAFIWYMLHQIKATQFYTNFLKLISSVVQFSISEVEF